MAKRVIAALVFLALVAAPATAQEFSFQTLSRIYDYDAAAPLNETLEPVPQIQGFDAYKLTYTSANNERVTAWYAVPHGTGPFPALILLHGYGGSKDDFVQLFPVVVPAGVALLAYDAPLHGERAIPGRSIFDINRPEESLNALVQTVLDGRRAVDFLVARPEIDPKRIGFVGASMGAILGTVLCGVEERIACAALLVGGADWKIILSKSDLPEARSLREQLTEEQLAEVARFLAPVDPIYFVGHISPRPLLLQFGKNDTVVPVQANRALLNAANEPVEVDWYDSGHYLPTDVVALRVLSWLAARLNVGIPAGAGG